MTIETTTAVHDPVLEKIEAALIDARREARLDDPAAQKLLDAATVLMSAGQRRLELARVAREAGMPASAARRIFGDRVALFRAHRQRAMVVYLEMMKGAVGALDGGDRVARVIETFGRLFAAPMGIAHARRTLAVNAAACDDERMRATYAGIEIMWNGILECVVAGEIGEGVAPFTPRGVTAILSACVDGVIAGSALTPELADPDRVVATSLGLWQLVRARCGEGAKR